MLPLLTAPEMRDVEADAIQAWGMPSRVLQEHAALGALALLPAQTPLVVLAGPGNNGGDALALARLARLQGRVVQVLALPGTVWRGDALAQADLWSGMGGTVAFPEDPAPALASFGGWVVDGLFGIGVRLPLGGAARTWVEVLQGLRRAGAPWKVLALDLPTGLDPSRAGVEGPVLRADRTAAFGHLKVCHGLRPAREACGEITTVPLPLRSAPQAGLGLQTAPQDDPPGWDTHKGTFGHVGIRAGSPGMSGAAVLAALGALHGGAGLVTVLVPADLRAEVAAQIPEAMVRVWEGEVPAGLDLLLVGPGGVTEVPAWAGPLVLDASALGEGQGAAWMDRPGTVLTPHPGEFRRLFGAQDLEGADARLAALRAVAQGPAVVVLKGAQTLVAGGQGPTVLACTTGHPGLSTGGSGDFLSGLLAARMVRWVKAGRPGGGEGLRRVAAEAVWLHGAAADRLGPGPLRVTELGPALASWMREHAHG